MRNQLKATGVGSQLKRNEHRLHSLMENIWLIDPFRKLESRMEFIPTWETDSNRPLSIRLLEACIRIVNLLRLQDLQVQNIIKN